MEGLRAGVCSSAPGGTPHGGDVAAELGGCSGLSPALAFRLHVYLASFATRNPSSQEVCAKNVHCFPVVLSGLVDGRSVCFVITKPCPPASGCGLSPADREREACRAPQKGRDCLSFEILPSLPSKGLSMSLARASRGQRGNMREVSASPECQLPLRASAGRRIAGPVGRSKQPCVLRGDAVPCAAC